MKGSQGHVDANMAPSHHACAQDKDRHVDALQSQHGPSQKKPKPRAASASRRSTATASTVPRVLDPAKEAKIDQLLQDQKVVALVQGGGHVHVAGMRGLAERFLDACAGSVPVAAAKLAKHLVWREEYNLAVCTLYSTRHLTC